MRILVVEDHASLAAGLKKDLGAAGFVVDWAANAEEGAFMGREEPYDAVILDLGLPDDSGLNVLRGWRAAGVDVPVIILTAWDAWHQRVDGLQAGGDDYLGKPFHMEELIARLNALIRRRHGVVRPALTLEGIHLDETDQQLSLANGELHTLTHTEFRLLRYLMLHPDQLLSKSQLTEHIYAYDEDRDSNVIEVYIKRLRRLLGQQRIETRRGQGYRLRSKP
ncbi:two component transcriptional regulator, winged helix family [Magnetococcus marinus MC-1]|uniref:Two component transcriptional regulator, winged helix family n=1 Tax=Magnetococcus marinus (strain ATCC BAA-1437 / JCM 17883 / MC-1) TaxID=156889 RepID=A0L4E6_MAGMM|nr:response regulator transcription factor [Magnetococcus marinus]ABK42839.1 two component transcriptional regulator, winged helix family [Magnetococcus marinus MC-1]